LISRNVRGRRHTNAADEKDGAAVNLPLRSPVVKPDSVHRRRIVPMRRPRAVHRVQLAERIAFRQGISNAWSAAAAAGRPVAPFFVLPAGRLTWKLGCETAQ
jgi:hypothetical protein